MITDNELYTMAIFLGSLAMLLIVLYHFLEINAKEDTTTPPPKSNATLKAPVQGQGKGSARS